MDDRARAACDLQICRRRNWPPHLACDFPARERVSCNRIECGWWCGAAGQARATVPARSPWRLGSTSALPRPAHSAPSGSWLPSVARELALSCTQKGPLAATHSNWVCLAAERLAGAVPQCMGEHASRVSSIQRLARRLLPAESVSTGNVEIRRFITHQQIPCDWLAVSA